MGPAAKLEYQDMENIEEEFAYLLRKEYPILRFIM